MGIFKKLFGKEGKKLPTTNQVAVDGTQADSFESDEPDLIFTFTNTEAGPEIWGSFPVAKESSRGPEPDSAQAGTEARQLREISDLKSRVEGGDAEAVIPELRDRISHEKNPKILLKLRSTLAEAHLHNGDDAEADIEYQLILELTNETSNYSLARADLNNYTLALVQADRLSEAVNWCQKWAEVICFLQENSGSESDLILKFDLVNVYRSIGMINKDLGNMERSREFLEKSVQVCRTMIDQNPHLIIKVYGMALAVAVQTYPAPAMAERELAEVVDVLGNYCRRDLKELPEPEAISILKGFDDFYEMYCKALVENNSDGQSEHIGNWVSLKHHIFDLGEYGQSDFVEPHMMWAQAVEREGDLERAARIFDGARKWAELVEKHEPGLVTDLMTEINEGLQRVHQQLGSSDR